MVVGSGVVVRSGVVGGGILLRPLRCVALPHILYCLESVQCLPCAPVGHGTKALLPATATNPSRLSPSTVHMNQLNCKKSFFTIIMISNIKLFHSPTRRRCVGLRRGEKTSKRCEVFSLFVFFCDTIFVYYGKCLKRV